MRAKCARHLSGSQVIRFAAASKVKVTSSALRSKPNLPHHRSDTANAPYPTTETTTTHGQRDEEWGGRRQAKGPRIGHENKAEDSNETRRTQYRKANKQAKHTRQADREGEVQSAVRKEAVWWPGANQTTAHRHHATANTLRRIYPPRRGLVSHKTALPSICVLYQRSQCFPLPISWAIAALNVELQSRNAVLDVLHGGASRSSSCRRTNNQKSQAALGTTQATRDRGVRPPYAMSAVQPNQPGGKKTPR